MLLIAGDSAAGDRAGLVDPQRDMLVARDFHVGAKRRGLAPARHDAQQRFDRRRRLLRAPHRIVVAGEECRLLGERLLLAPFDEDARARHVRAGDRHAGCEGRDRFAVFADLFLIALGDPGQCRETRVCHRRRARCRSRPRRGSGPSALVRGRDLAGRGRRFEVGHPDRQQHLPAAAAGEPADGLQLCRVDRARGPRRLRGGGVGPGDVLIGGDAAEADDPRAERAQQVHEVAAVGVLADLIQRRRLEGEAEEGLRGRAGPGARRLIVTATGSGGWAPAGVAATQSASVRQMTASAAADFDLV